MGFEPPEALLRAVFVAVAMYFSLRGGQETYDLKVDQFKQVQGEGYSKKHITDMFRTARTTIKGIFQKQQNSEGFC